MAKVAIKYIQMSDSLRFCAHVNIAPNGESNNIRLTSLSPHVGALPNYRHLYGNLYDSVSHLKAELANSASQDMEYTFNDVLINPDSLLRELSTLDSVDMDNWLYAKDRSDLRIKSINDILYMNHEEEGWVLRFYEGEWTTLQTTTKRGNPKVLNTDSLISA